MTTSPTQGEHAQPEAPYLQLADLLASGQHLVSVERKEAADAIRTLHAQVAALTAAPQGGAYAELPAPNLPRGGFPDLFTADQMRAFADATHALRTQQPAPAGATSNTHWNQAPCAHCGCTEGQHFNARCHHTQGETRYTPTAQAADSVLEDAARYRWLAEHPNEWRLYRKHGNHKMPFRMMRDGDPWGQSFTSADEAIDAARKQGGAT